MGTASVQRTRRLAVKPESKGLMTPRVANFFSPASKNEELNDWVDWVQQLLQFLRSVSSLHLVFILLHLHHLLLLTAWMMRKRGCGCDADWLILNKIGRTQWATQTISSSSSSSSQSSLQASSGLWQSSGSRVGDGPGGCGVLSVGRRPGRRQC